MSSQRGNVSRTRAQKHQNTKMFKNNLHDKSKKTQILNSIQVTNVCDRCKAIIEWKIKYKKYKQLKSAKTCIKCLNKNIKQSYHTICEPCVEKLRVCAKCGTSDFRNGGMPLSTEPKIKDSKKGIEVPELSEEESDGSENESS